MSLSIWHVILVLVVVLILFGAGKLPRVMGDVAKGIKNFKSGLGDDTKPSDPPAVPPRAGESDTKSDKDSAPRA